MFVKTLKTMNKEQVIKLITDYGWPQVESKNPYMVSFVHPEDKAIRINYYFTSWTITLQAPNHQIVIIKDITIDDLEDLFLNA